MSDREPIETIELNSIPERNYRRPIHTLHREILIEVLLLTLPAPKHSTTTEFYTRVTTLSLVSHAWNDLVYNTASFWTFISSRMPLEVLKRIISLSGLAPLTIYAGNSNWPSESEPTETPFWRNIAPELPRCREFRITETKFAMVVLQQEMSELRVLQVACPRVAADHENDSNSSRPHLLLSQAFGRNLNEMRMKRAVYPWNNSPSLNNLSKLVLSHSQVAMSDFVHFLANTPALVDLGLDAVTFMSEWSPTTHNGKVILPNLQSISASRINGDQLIRLTRAIEPSNCSQFFLSQFSEPLFRLPDLPEWVSIAVDRVIKALEPQEIVSVSLGPRYLEFGSDGTFIQVFGPSDAEGIRWITKLLPSLAPFVTIELQVSQSSVEFIKIEALHRIQCSVELELLHQGSHREFFESLGRSREGFGGNELNTRLFPFHNMTKLKICLPDTETDDFLNVLAVAYRCYPSGLKIQELVIGLVSPREDVRDRARDILGHPRANCVPATKNHYDTGAFWSLPSLDDHGEEATESSDDESQSSED